MNVESKIGGHWLTFVTEKPLEAVLDVLAGKSGAVEQTFAFGHKKRLGHETGAYVYFGSPSPDQPIVVNLPGEVCEQHFDLGLSWCHRLDARTTRLDLANDVGPQEQARARLYEMVDAFKAKQCVTKMRQGEKGSWIVFQSGNPGDGHTAYFGGKTADQRLRAYDRRGDLRLEWQWRPPKGMSKSVAKMMLERGVEPMWRSLAQSCVWPMPWYQALLTGDAEQRVRDEAVDTALTQAVIAFREQAGPSLWAMLLAGVPITDLVSDPGDDLRGDQARKFIGWAKDAAKMGYDEHLAAAVGERLKARAEKDGRRRAN